MAAMAMAMAGDLYENAHLGACFLNSPCLILVDSCSNFCYVWTFLLSLSMGHYTLVD